MSDLLSRHAEAIDGVLSCYDRILIQGTLPDIAYDGAMTRFFFQAKRRIFDFADWAKPYKRRIREHIEALAQTEGLKIEFIRRIDDMRKEERIEEVLRERGRQPGLVHILSAMETCSTYQPWHDKPTGQNYFRQDTGRCLHYYVYFIDKDLGLCHLRIPTWAPFRLQFCLNGHNWLACQMRRARIDFSQVDNAFVAIEDYAAAQALADSFGIKRLHRVLDAAVRRYAPSLRDFRAGVHWSIMQAEFATDIVFKTGEQLKPLYEEIVRTLVHSVHPDRVAMFLGRRLDEKFRGELGSDLIRRHEGMCLRHFMKDSGIKIYDKFGRILRIESFTNNISFFKHHRRVEHRDGTHEYKQANLRKTIYSLSDLAEIMGACNRRYLEFLGAVDDPGDGIRKVEKISEVVHEQDRAYRGFNLFQAEDVAVLRTVGQAHVMGFGFANQHLRQSLPNKSAGQIGHILKRLRKHGLIKKVASRYKYYPTTLGKIVIATALKLKEMLIIPLLRGQLAHT